MATAIAIIAAFVAASAIIMAVRSEKHHKATTARWKDALNKIYRLEEKAAETQSEIDEYKSTIEKGNDKHKEDLTQAYHAYTGVYLNLRETFVTDVAQWLKRYNIKNAEKALPASGVAFKDLITLYTIFTAWKSFGYEVLDTDIQYIQENADKFADQLKLILVGKSDELTEDADLPLVKSLPELTLKDFIVPLGKLVEAKSGN